MESVVSLIQGSDKLTAIFGDWPSFHDAEIVELNLTRREARPENNAQRSPALTLRVHHWAMTKDIDEKGYFILRNHTPHNIEIYWRFGASDGWIQSSERHLWSFNNRSADKRERAPLQYPD